MEKKKVSNFKLNCLLTLDWLKDFWWIPVGLIILLIVKIFPDVYMWFSITVFGLALFITAWFFYWAIYTVIVNIKISKLNEKKKKEYNRLLAEFKKRKIIMRKRMELQWLKGNPITLHDPDGTIRIIQSGQTDVIMSTMN